MKLFQRKRILKQTKKLHMSEEVMKMIALEVVRERLLDHVHQVVVVSIDSSNI